MKAKNLIDGRALLAGLRRLQAAMCPRGDFGDGYALAIRDLEILVDMLEKRGLSVETAVYPCSHVAAIGWKHECVLTKVKR